MTNSADPNQLASTQSTKAGYIWDHSRTSVSNFIVNHSFNIVLTLNIWTLSVLLVVLKFEQAED